LPLLPAASATAMIILDHYCRFRDTSSYANQLAPTIRSNPFMTAPTNQSARRPVFGAGCSNAGIEPGDSEELRLNKSLLMLATGLAASAIILWVAIYSILGPQFSYTAPFAFQLLLAGNMLLLHHVAEFRFFPHQPARLFLFLPFIAQWSGGTIISTSGVMLWALLAPSAPSSASA
jgi:hypothetical protein